MDFRIRHIAAGFILFGAGAGDGAAAEPRTWYVYCEGASPEGHWAVFSENFWPHPEAADYGRRVGSAAKAFFEMRHDLALEGCAGVDFRDDRLAEHSRTLTVQLHRRMGDRIYFFRLPSDVLPVDGTPTPIAAAAPVGEGVGEGAAEQVAGGSHEERRSSLGGAPR